MIDLYRAAAAQCTSPVGSFVNDQVAYFTFVHCAETDEQAMRNGAAAAAAWYTVTALRFFNAAAEFAATMQRHQDILATGGDGLTGEFLRAEVDAAPTEAQLVIGRIIQGEDVPEDEVFEVLSAQQSLIVGSPDTCRKKLRAYADLGIDRLMCLQQIGPIGADEVMTSIRLIGELIPEFDRS
ncbi:LLM class flavin-dependent oxidoreductase [Lentzea californiensis]|uniref:LLM class flavin-dependent oxidoreductase n=1 Tax=Lentzea californiensis TaxID=438851 RepID=UPI002166A34E|nr:LLM class flavin-dependent oxidoreductase [Lentzea californiensis]MCR3750631.1 Luciferase-like monooxygenase [Lentzea californiensis]